ncbi:GPP34 family phosphoprotein [Rhodococcus triatomae]|uniref:Golgi phosphoprotein 3 (GPP34) n=1 Tax=Rhodococcus triatomae TaxID=300028 RepID=A0A1G8APW2_9NOCA|nr:GPP34 family phosphoprotein [Rhodococcus triatomae]QNG17703.1 GPP34 family phosphoprotein [Rhodococcus triatomae]QNG22630.1 GPP34 family phosphoprotein [Rhodococcus triatomae]SDH22957.1 Golgi phosphoprotein 3 (GPP34) [Rhodococcus triatomae]
MTLLAEDLLLLMLDEESGKPLVDSTKLPRVLAGAVLLDLALTGVVTPAEPGEDARKGRLVIRTQEFPEDPLLRDAVEIVGKGRPLKPESAIEKLSKGIRDKVATRLVADGWVREERSRILGLFPSVRWPQVDGSREHALRAEIGASLVDGITPTHRTAALISLIAAVDVAPKLFPNADKRAMKKRAKEIAEGDWAGKAVRKAVDAVNTAIMIAATTPAIVAASS